MFRLENWIAFLLLIIIGEFLPPTVCLNFKSISIHLSCRVTKYEMFFFLQILKHSCSNVVITGQYLPNLLSLLPVSLCIYSVMILITTNAITSISIKTNKQIDTEYPYCFCLNTLCCPLDFTTGSILFASSVRIYSSIHISYCKISILYHTLFFFVCFLKKVKLFSINKCYAVHEWNIFR